MHLVTASANDEEKKKNKGVETTTNRGRIQTVPGKLSPLCAAMRSETIDQLEKIVARLF